MYVLHYHSETLRVKMRRLFQLQTLLEKLYKLIPIHITIIPHDSFTEVKFAMNIFNFL